jgi:hypothetical protein
MWEIGHILIYLVVLYILDCHAKVGYGYLTPLSTIFQLYHMILSIEEIRST